MRIVTAGSSDEFLAKYETIYWVQEQDNMIYESYPWKQDLLRRKRLFLAYNTSEHFQKDDERTYTVLEKSIFIPLLLFES